jgi:hypothetical protein
MSNPTSSAGNHPPKRTISPKENLLRAIRRDHPRWVPEGLDGPVNMADTVTIWAPVVERPDEEPGLDAFSVDWSYHKDAEGGTYPTIGGHTLSDISKWRDELIIPDVEDQDWDGIRAQAEAVDRDEKLLMGFVQMGLFERSYLLLGMEEALMAFMTNPDEMYEMLGAVADYKIELIRKFDDVIDMDMLWYGDDWGMQRALFLPPDIWRRVIKPHTKRIYDCMREREIIINQHCCGKIDAVFGDMVEIGADLWNPCQPCNDLPELKRKYGDRISFHGAIDSQFVLHRPGVTADEVRAEARRCIDMLAPGGGYIAGPSHHVPYDPELIEALQDEVETYGGAFYAQD